MRNEGELPVQNDRMRVRVELLQDILFCLNFVLWAATLLFVMVPNGTHTLFVVLEKLGARIVGSQATDFLAGRYAFGILASIFFVPVYVVLRSLRNSQLKKELFRSTPGIAVLSMAPTIWLSLSAREGHASWQCILLSAASLIAIFQARFFLKGYSRIRAWAAAGILGAYCLAWLQLTGKSYSFSNYLTGPVGPALAFSSMLVWGWYVTLVDRSHDRVALPQS